MEIKYFTIERGGKIPRFCPEDGALLTPLKDGSYLCKRCSTAYKSDKGPPSQKTRSDVNGKGDGITVVPESSEPKTYDNNNTFGVNPREVDNSN